MAKPPPPAPHGLAAALARIVSVETREIGVVLASFAMFFCVLCGYYILRPVRDEMGIAVGPDGLQRLFVAVFVVMLLAVPLFGWIVSNFARRRIVPLIYGFFVVNLVLFWFALSASPDAPSRPVFTSLLGMSGDGASIPLAAFDPSIASVFFVWASVFNLFVVSLFWSLMSELYASEQAKRLFGFIAAGGSAGAIAGPLLTRSAVHHVAPFDLLLASAVLIALGLVAALVLRRLVSAKDTARNEEPAGGKGLLAGAAQVFSSPYLFGIALYILLANLIGTYFYLEQSRIVGAELADRAARVSFFAGRDLLVSVATILIQVLVTGRVMRSLGLAVPLATLPVCAGVGLIALAIAPSLQVVAAVMAAERAIAFGLANPALKALYTVVGTEEKYKAQNFIDTVVYRGGDAASGLFFNTAAKAAGLSGGAIAVLSLPLAGVWLVTALRLARQQACLAKSEAAPASGEQWR